MMFMKFYFFLLLVSFGVFVNGAAIHRRAGIVLTAAPEANGAVNPALFQASAEPTVISIQGGDVITLADVGVTTVFAGKTWTIVPPTPTGTGSGAGDGQSSSSSSSAEPTSTDSGDSSSAVPTSTTSGTTSAEPTSTTSGTTSAEHTSTTSGTASAEPTGDGESSSSAEPTSTTSGTASTEPTSTTSGTSSAEPTGDGESSSASGSSSGTTTSGTSEPTSTDDGESSARPTAVVTTVLTTDGATETIVSSPGPFITLAPTGTTTSFAGHLYTIVPASRLTTSVTSSSSSSSTAEPSSTGSANGGVGNSNAAMSLHSFTFRGFIGIVGGAVIGAWLTL